MTSERLKELKELCDKATPGPWRTDESTIRGTTIQFKDRDYDCPSSWQWSDLGSDLPTRGTHSYWRDDAEFIAASRTAIPELIAEVERLRIPGDHKRILKAAVDKLIKMPTEEFNKLAEKHSALFADSEKEPYDDYDSFRERLDEAEEIMKQECPLNYKLYLERWEKK